MKVPVDYLPHNNFFKNLSLLFKSINHDECAVGMRVKFVARRDKK